MTQEGILLERLQALDRSRRGHVSSISRLCNEIDEHLQDFANIVKVRTLQSQLNIAWDQFSVCCSKYANLLENTCDKYQGVVTQRKAQQIRVQDYNHKIEQFVTSAASFYNNQVTDEMKTSKKTSPTGSVKSTISRVSKLSVSSSKVREAKAVAAKALLIQQQAEEMKRRKVEVEMKKMEIEIKQREIELQNKLELTILEAESEVVAAKNQAELARLEASLAEQEVQDDERDEVVDAKESINLDAVQKGTPYAGEMPIITLPSTFTIANTPGPVLGEKPFQTSTPATDNHQPTCLTVPPGVRFSPQQGPCMDSAITDIEETNKNKPPRAQDQDKLPTFNDKNVMDETLLTIMSTMEKISVSHDLPQVQVQRFDGSPERYPAFRQRFKQMVESRPLDNAVKITRLLQFLEGPALMAVQRYEPVPGGLEKALKTLEDRFGQPYQIVKACVETLTKGPSLQVSDKESLQRYADDAQVTYDTLEAMGYISEMNTDNLEKIIGRLPKWMQTKFAEHLKGLERKGQVMPTFKDVVNFLRERAYVLNHPFFSKSQSENVNTYVKPRSKPVTPRVSTYATTTTNTESCPMCSQPHRLYRCETFKAKSPQERSEFVKKRQICFNCISSTEHNSRKCKSLIRCRAEGCGKPHHTMLHFTEQREYQTHKNDEASAPVPNKGNTSTCSAGTSVNNSDVLLQVIPVKVISSTGSHVTTYGLVDSGSDITMIDPSLVKMLNIKGSPSKLSLTTVSSADEQQEGMKVDFKIAPVDCPNDQVIDVKSAWAVKDLTIPLKHTKIAKTVEHWPHLQQVRFPDVERKKISILLGTNVQEVFIPLEVRRGGPNEPLAIKSCIGWSILGGSFNTKNNKQTHLNLSVSGEDLSLNSQLEEFWKIESYGTDKQEANPMSVEDRKALKLIDNSISKQEGHYQMGLLWKDENPKLPYNRALAEARIQHLRKRFQRDPELEVKYRAVMDEYLAKGYAKRLTEEETAKRSDITWYLPHHPVLNANKPGKVRVVFDAAAKYAETSLNDNLIQGPNLTNDLVGVLQRFRQHEAAFTADVEAMFYQARVLPKDTDALRFLWWTGSKDDPPAEYKMLVHIFGAKSSPCCANKALKMTAEDNKDKYSSEVVESARRNFYVDDVLKSVSTTEQAIYIATELAKLLNEGGFHLTKFTSNRREILAAIPQEERASPLLDLDLDQLPVERALGVYWDSESDAFKFKVVQTDKPPTKRGILSVVSSLFDPLGFLSPFIFPVKVLLQELWRMGLHWDQEIPEPYLSQWRKWVETLPHIINIEIPRCYKPPGFGTLSTVQLHNFADASRRGYAAVTYLRLVDEQGKIHSAFVMGKTRNAPMKEQTIPRLELQAAVLATRLYKTIMKEIDLQVHEAFFWSDSTTTLQYIKNTTKRFQTFVANRVTEIQDTTSPDQWHHVPGASNPADEGSRGVDIQYFHHDCRWWSGPDFLLQPEHEWPNAQVEDLPDDDEEIRKTPTVFLTTTSESQIEHLLRRYSSWLRLLRVMSWVLRFVRHLKKEKLEYDVSSTLTLAETQQASQEIARLAQCQTFQEEYIALKGGQQVKLQSKLANLSPTLVDGIIRVGGRVHRAPIAFDASHPIILPRDHPVSILIVRHYHRNLGHAGREHVLSAIRQKYWILGARSLIKRILHQCVNCRKRNAPTMEQKMADLPKERLVPYQPPFTYTGLDFFGPFHVKRGRGTVKVYGCIFTCFNSRAVHIEDVSSLETDTFIQALHRFISVRGCPKEIWSDNGSNFTGADRELRRSVKELNEESIKKELHLKEAEWHSCPLPKWRFQPPTASNMSGVWERLIRSVRKAMKGVLGDPNALIGLETLRTVFAEVTSILNSRPLCPSSDDPNDFESLTPNHLLLQRQNLVLPPGVFAKEDLYSRKQWRHAQFLANCFWTRWIREYIPTLQRRQKWIRDKRNLTVNDLVLIADNTLPRSRWLLGRVTKVFPGQDKRVRVAEIKTKSSLLVRPVNKLCLISEAL